MKRAIFLLLLFAAPAWAQNPALQINYGPTLPSVCNPSTGDVFVLTGNTSARGLYLCGSSNAWEMVNGTGYFDVKLFGAKGTGTVDDAPAFRSAAAAAGVAGGTVFIPPGRYLLASKSPAPFIIDPPDNVSWLGSGYASELFVGPGMNGPGVAPADDFWVLYSVALSNATFRNFRINFNGVNNLLPAGDPAKEDYGIGCTTCTNVTVEGVWFENEPGQRMISMTGVNGVIIRGNRLHNIGTAVPGNVLSPDYSMIATDSGVRALIADNILWNDTFAGEGTAIEVWTSHANVHGNIGLNQGKAFNIVAQGADQFDSVYANNTFRGLNTAIQGWTGGGFTLRDITVANNVFVQENPNAAAPSLAQVNLYNTVATLLDSMLITGNTFRSTLVAGANIGSGIDIGSVGKLTVSNNLFQGIAGRAVNLVTITTATLELAIINNIIRDCGITTNAGYQGGIILNQVAGTVVKSCRIDGNTIQNTGAPGMTTAIGGNADMTDLLIQNNHIISIATRISMTGTLTLRHILDTGSLSLSTFAALGAPANGQFRYCSDCTIANPCAGGGTGALAKRLNGAWVCN